MGSTARRRRGLLSGHLRIKSCRPMKTVLALVLLLAASVAPALADDYTLDNRPQIVFSGRGGDRIHLSPYPMSSRAADIWKADACWRGCGAKCAAQFNACGRANGAEACRSGLDHCDRMCVFDCRLSRGPLLYSFE
jgi:hypothetical protein